MNNKTFSLEQITSLNKQVEKFSAVEVLQFVLSSVEGKPIFTTSFGAEDQALTHLLAENKYAVDIITLDTGRLFNETLETYEKTIRKYGNIIKTLFPESRNVENYVNKNGINAFYSSVELRKECCRIRKILPLERGLKDYGIWITGLRANQSENRSGLKYFEWDERFKILKVNPLLNWSYDDIKNYIQANFIPYNLLHDKGFVSIGCAPCTRAIEEGEDFRAGRWWWEQSQKECGLHHS